MIFQLLEVRIGINVKGMSTGIFDLLGYKLLTLSERFGSSFGFYRKEITVNTEQAIQGRSS